MIRNSAWLWALGLAASVLAACTGDTIVLEDDDGESDGSGGDSSTGASSQGGSAQGGAGAGSQGGNTTTSNPQTAGYQKFVNEVHPALNGACGSCHTTGESSAPTFWSTSADAAYTKVTNPALGFIAVPANSQLMLHGQHAGPALTGPQADLVSAWLMIEVEERGLVDPAGGGGAAPPVGPTLQEALESFGNCMTYEDWVNAGIPQLADDGVSEDGACIGCHQAGDGGALISLNDQQMFEASRDFPYIKKFVSGTVTPEGAFDGLIPAYRFRNKGLEAQECDENTDNCHPAYTLPPNIDIAIDNFVNLTLDRYNAGLCP